MKKSVRQEVDKFFKPDKYNAARELDHEGMYDSHMQNMFKPTGHLVEQGRRKLGNQDIKLSGKAYEA